MHKYEVIIYWSNEDGAYVAEVPELPGCMAHADTQEAALEHVGQAVELWLETAREFGDPIPEPKGERLTLAWETPLTTIAEAVLVLEVLPEAGAAA